MQKLKTPSQIKKEIQANIEDAENHISESKARRRLTVGLYLFVGIAICSYLITLNDVPKEVKIGACLFFAIFISIVWLLLGSGIDNMKKALDEYKNNMAEAGKEFLNGLKNN